VVIRKWLECKNPVFAKAEFLSSCWKGKSSWVILETDDNETSNLATFNVVMASHLIPMS